MKAIVQERYGSPDGLVLREIDKPAVGDDQVLVKVRAASVNAADWHLMKRLPHLIGKLLGSTRTSIPGSDLAGVIEAVGKNVTRWKPGDEVFGVGPGAFAEYATTTQDRLAPKPGPLTFEQAAAIPVAGLTALQGLRDKAQLQPGQRVLVYGAGGGCGTFAVLIAKALGAHVTAVSSTRNAGMLRAIGADEFIDYTREDFAKRGGRYDVFVDLGADRSFADCRRVLAENGALVLVGAAGGLGPILIRLLAAQVRSRILRQRVVTFMARVRREDLVALSQLAEAGKLTPAIDRAYPLSGVPDALRHVGTRRAQGKVVISVG